MAWQDRTELAATPADGDEVALKDASDTTDNAAGTVKRISLVNLFGALLRLAGGTLTGALTLGAGASIDGGGKVIAHHLTTIVLTVSGTLTITAHSGNVIKTSGNITIPTTTGFHCTVIAGGAHTITFNGTVTAALATGDIVSLFVESATVIHAIRVLSANKLAFA